ncbi:MAG: bifunctional glycosyltransferase family 2/GtrA family protein, partial [Acidobacteriota bacterium]
VKHTTQTLCTPSCASTPCAPERGTARASHVIVLIPAYQPTAALATIVSELVRSPLIASVIVINDGSGKEFDPIFEALSRFPKTALLQHVVNLGKGAALKAGINYTACTFPDAAGFVSADADGQHSTRDILHVAETLVLHPSELILGVRRFAGPVPLRSKLGNIVTRHVLRAVTGQRISDTQTGLRGIPTGFAPALMRLRPNGYDFELEVLLTCKKTMRHIRELAIETIYTDGNSSSHFNPLLDSMRVYFVLIRFIAASLATAGLDNFVFILAYALWPHILGCQALSRGLAGLFNYCINKRGVFHSRASNRSALPRYYASVLAFGALSYGMIIALCRHTPMPAPAAKVVAESILFAFSFVIQRDFVFTSRPAHERDSERVQEGEAASAG